MSQIGKWGKHVFEVSPNVILGFTGLQIKGSSDTTAKKKQSKEYVTRKGGKATEISLTVHLYAATGCSVQKEAKQFIADARAGKKNYFYIGKKKLVSYRMMLTDATVKDIKLSPKAKWISANVTLTLKQAEKGGGGKNKSKKNAKAKGSHKVSARSSGTKVSASSSWTKAVNKNNTKTPSSVKHQKEGPLSVNAVFTKSSNALVVKNSNLLINKYRKAGKQLTKDQVVGINNKPQNMGTIAYRYSPMALMNVGGKR